MLSVECSALCAVSVYPSELESEEQRPRSHTVDNFCQGNCDAHGILSQPELEIHLLRGLPL